MNKRLKLKNPEDLRRKLKDMKEQEIYEIMQAMIEEVEDLERRIISLEKK